MKVKLKMKNFKGGEDSWSTMEIAVLAGGTRVCFKETAVYMMMIVK